MNEAASMAARPLPERWSPLAVASLVLSVLPVGSAVAPMLGAAALLQMRRRTDLRGRALAWAGIATGFVATTLMVLAAWGVWGATKELAMRPEAALRAAWAGDAEAFRRHMTEPGSLATAEQVEAWVAPVRARLGELREVRMGKSAPEAKGAVPERELPAAYEAVFAPAGDAGGAATVTVPVVVTFARPASTEAIDSIRIKRFLFRMPDGTRIVFPEDERPEAQRPAGPGPGPR
jgi:hypothetical protein